MNADWSVPQHTFKQLRAKASRHAVLIPVFNEGARIQSQLKKMSTLNTRFDCLIVDGGSTDGALNEDLLAKTNVAAWITTVSGLSSQLRVGLAFALQHGYDGVILIDGNDKDEPSAIASFAAKLDEGFDHVQGSRFMPGGQAIHNPRNRLMAIRFIHAPLISWASGFRYTDTTNGYRAYSSRFLTDNRVQPFREVFTRYELHYYLAIQAARLDFKVIEIPVTRSYPRGQKTPTKIKGLRGNFEILKTLFRAVCHRYDPPPRNVP